jgi:hypothetical protein
MPFKTCNEKRLFYSLKYNEFFNLFLLFCGKSTSAACKGREEIVNSSFQWWEVRTPLRMYRLLKGHATETQELVIIHYILLFLYRLNSPKRIILISFQNLELLQGRSSSLVGYGIGIAEVVGSNPTRSILSIW